MLVGVGRDGATVNVAGQNGLRGQMQRASSDSCTSHNLNYAC